MMYLVSPLLKRIHSSKSLPRSAQEHVSFIRRFASILPPYELVPIAEEHMQTGSTQDEIAQALEPHYKAQTPVVLRQAVAAAPAVAKWQSLPYLQEALEEEIGTVEIGGSYVNDNVERPEIPLDQYVQYLQLFQAQYGAQGPDDPWHIPEEINVSELVYLAQNDLFQNLYQDVHIPALCDTSQPPFGHGQLYSVMLWLGPRGCVSPLHYDPLDNLLMQFMGRKRVLLFPAGNAPIYAASGSGGGQQSNTSPVNVEDPDYTTFPTFREAPSATLCLTLNPGDALYIPAKWWHHVRSLDTSASVNVWWR
jgi:lysine-specific demethylase 8